MRTIEGVHIRARRINGHSYVAHIFKFKRELWNKRLRRRLAMGDHHPITCDTAYSISKPNFVPMSRLALRLGVWVNGSKEIVSKETLGTDRHHGPLSSYSATAESSKFGPTVRSPIASIWSRLKLTRWIRFSAHTRD